MRPSLNERRFRIYKKINVQQVHNKYEENVENEGTSFPIKTYKEQTRDKIIVMAMIGMKMIVQKKSV